MTKKSRYNEQTWAGWHTFAAFLMFVVGSVNFVQGLVAIFADDVLLGETERFTLILDVTGWGWVHLIWGVILMVAGVSLFLGKAWARWVGILMVMSNIVTQTATISFHPVYSVLVIAMDVFILWALVVHADVLAER